LLCFKEVANGGKEEHGTDSNPSARNHIEMEHPCNEVWGHQQ